jgi:catechol 2,3-dioxygenase-like lactoylglutathione lyase family enzyme
MAIALDHLIVPTKDRVASAKLLGTLLGVPLAEQANIGPFSPVFVSDTLTVDFDQWTEPVPKLHYCFSLGPDEFDAVLPRILAAGIRFRSLPRGNDDDTVNDAFGGKLLYWSDPDGHTWEILTVSYARQRPPPPAGEHSAG